MPNDLPCHRTGRLLFVFAVATTLISACAAQERVSAEKRSQIEAAVSKFMSATHVPGISIAVVEDGELGWATGFGFADLENNVPASEHTLFRLASISKSLSATAAMELVERGKLDLDAPVQKYCRAFPEKSATISTRLAMGHLAGIRHYKSSSQDDPEIGNTKHFDDPIQGGLAFFKDDPLLSKPGDEFHYSTQGYTLVGCVIEGASGVKYTEFMRRNVFLPAGMEQTQPDNRFVIIPYRTRFYQKDKSGAVENADFLDSSYKVPGGGWLSSAEDMARFEVAILDGKLLKPATRDVMWKPLQPAKGKPNGYALGWGTFAEDGRRSVGHDGGQQGTSTNFLIVPERRAGVVVLANMEDVPVSDLSKEILNIILRETPTQKQ
jgi:serine beta-lactamase-like protein LACTB, mitochondrial